MTLPVPVELPLEMLRRAILEPNTHAQRSFTKTAFALAAEAAEMVESDAAIEAAQLQLQRALLAFSCSAKSGDEQVAVLAAVQRFAESLESAPPSDHARDMGLNW